MYELPEIELVRANITEKFSGVPIKKVYVSTKSILGKRIKFLDELTHATIWFVERRSNRIILHLDNGKRVLIEPGKNTRFYGDEKVQFSKQDADLILYFENKTCLFTHLDEHSVQLLTVRELDQQLKILAPDAFDKSFTLQYFATAISKKRSSIKNVLTDGKTVLGIQGTYSDEILFESKIHPSRKAFTLSEQEVNLLFNSILYVLKEATTDGGSVPSPMSSQDVFSGSFVDKHQVHERAGENCLRCESEIEQVTVSKQKCFVCSNCQV